MGFVPDLCSKSVTDWLELLSTSQALPAGSGTSMTSTTLNQSQNQMAPGADKLSNF